MKTIINIGTNKKNITGVEFNKKFEDITIQDIYDVCLKEFGNKDKLMIIGWCDVTHEHKRSKNN